MVSTRGSVVSDYNVDLSSYKMHRTLNSHPPPELPKVRRQLFGFTEKVETALQLQDFTERTAKSSQDWNFDFVKECPLTGRFLWHRVRARDMPAFYTAVRRPNLNVTPHHNDSEEDTDGEDYYSTSNEENEHFDVEERHEKVERSSSKKPRLVQTSMKDFTRVQKRRSSRRLLLKQLSSRKIRRYLHPSGSESVQL